MRTNTKIALTASLVLAMAFTFGCSDDTSSGGGVQLLPCADGTVTINTQTWQKCNLNVPVTTGKSECFNNKPENCDIYGRLYDWATAMALPSKCNTTLSTSDPDCAVSAKHRGLCPESFHIPSKDDWQTLFDYVGGNESTVSKNLKAQNGWPDCGPKGSSRYVCEDAVGFSLLPSKISTIVSSASLWSADENNDKTDEANLLIISLGVNIHSYKKSSLSSVRCVKD